MSAARRMTRHEYAACRTPEEKKQLRRCLQCKLHLAGDAKAFCVEGARLFHVAPTPPPPIKEGRAMTTPATADPTVVAPATPQRHDLTCGCWSAVIKRQSPRLTPGRIEDGGGQAVVKIGPSGLEFVMEETEDVQNGYCGRHSEEMALRQDEAARFLDGGVKTEDEVAAFSGARTLGGGALPLLNAGDPDSGDASPLASSTIVGGCPVADCVFADKHMGGHRNANGNELA